MHWIIRNTTMFFLFCFVISLKKFTESRTLTKPFLVQYPYHVLFPPLSTTTFLFLSPKPYTETKRMTVTLNKRHT